MPPQTPRFPQLPPSVAAGHPATARIGADLIDRGAGAADAVVAMILAGCVAETIFTGLGGGGFATYFDASTRQVTGLDFFVAVPGLDGSQAGPTREIDVQFGSVQVPYMVGGATVCVPGTPAGVAELHRRFGRASWSDVVSPARDLAESGVAFSAAHAALLPDVAAAMLLGAGIASYSRPAGAAAAGETARRLLAEGELLHHPELADTLDLLRTYGADVLYSGPIGRRLVTESRADGGALSDTDMAAYRVRELPLVDAGFGDFRLRVRGNDLDGFAATAAALSVPEVLASPARRAGALVNALRQPARRGETTSLAAVDRDGNGCAATHSLGLGSGIWVGGVHANSMLGEGELLRGELRPGDRMPSMMVPSVVTDRRGALALVGGAAGGSRIRSALVQVLSRTLLEGMSMAQAIAAPRLSATTDVVHLEPGFEPEVAPSLAAAGETVIEWAESKPYFGGVAAIGFDGPGADPRRGGCAVRVS